MICTDGSGRRWLLSDASDSIRALRARARACKFDYDDLGPLYGNPQPLQECCRLVGIDGERWAVGRMINYGPVVVWFARQLSTG